MKRTYGLVALGCVLSGVDAKLVRWAAAKREEDWHPAQATIAVDQLLQGTTPRPTEAPKLPGLPARGLDRRASSSSSNTDNTCAYISGITASSLYCDPTNDCVYNSIAKYIGCCPDSVLSPTSHPTTTATTASCPVWTTCLDYTDSELYTTNNGWTMYCGQTQYPYCIEHVYKDPRWTGYTLLGCARDSTDRTDFVYYTPTSLSDSLTTSTSSDESSTITSSPTTTSSATTTSSSAATSTSPAPIVHKSSHVGAIVGGVVGGVAGLALIGLAAFFLLRRRKPKTDPAPAAAAATGAAGAAAAAPGQGPPPGAPGGYDPNQPQMAQQQGQYGYGAAGFTPVDPRASIAKPPYATQAYDPAFSPPGSPAPAYNLPPGATPPPAAAYGQPPHSPDGTGYGQPGQQPYQATQYNQYQNTQGQPGYGQPTPPPPHPTQFAAELPTQRGDGEVRELAG